VGEDISTRRGRRNSALEPEREGTRWVKVWLDARTARFTGKKGRPEPEEKEKRGPNKKRREKRYKRAAKGKFVKMIEGGGGGGLYAGRRMSQASTVGGMTFKKKLTDRDVLLAEKRAGAS